MNLRVDHVERQLSDIKHELRSILALATKLAGVEATIGSLATKQELADKLGDRPTRNQIRTDLIWIVTLVGAVLTVASRVLGGS